MLSTNYVIESLEVIINDLKGAQTNTRNLRRKDGTQITDITEEPSRLGIIENSIASGQTKLIDLRKEISIGRIKKESNVR